MSGGSARKGPGPRCLEGRKRHEGKAARRKKAGGLRGRMIAFADRHMEPIFIAPAMVVTIVLLAWPICMSIYYSLPTKACWASRWNLWG
mgnify:CR=1 FL=1